jgi:hypothetical protein
MRAIFFINDSESINQSKHVDRTQCDACCTAKTSIFINNKVVLKLSWHDVWMVG